MGPENSLDTEGLSQLLLIVPVAADDTAAAQAVATSYLAEVVKTNVTE